MIIIRSANCGLALGDEFAVYGVEGIAEPARFGGVAGGALDHDLENGLEEAAVLGQSGAVV